MNDFRLSALKPRYEELFNTCLLRSRWMDQITSVAEQIQNGSSVYQQVQDQTTVPWWVVGILHYRDLNFQDDGFAQMAIDALRNRKFDQAKDHSIEAWLWRIEAWNGWGYASMGLNSEYLWNGTNHFGSGNNQGIFLSDGQFDPTGTSQQVGAGALVWYLYHQGLLSNSGAAAETASSTWGGVNISLSTTGGSSGSVESGVAATLELAQAFQYYRNLPHQDQAIAWLHSQLSPDLLAEFAQRWRDNTPVKATVTVSAFANNNTVAVAAVNPLPVAPPTAPTTPTTPTSVQLKVPYLSQLDNLTDPYGTCNVTSASMCMAYFGHPIRNDQGQQLEDELNQYCYANGLSRHSPTDIAKVIRSYGYKDDFQSKAKWEDVKRWLQQGNPCIVHGWFSRSGHIITIIGYNDKGWIVHDPYGEWYSSGYDTNKSGEGLTYSYKMMDQLCASDGELWIHYVSK